MKTREVIEGATAAGWLAGLVLVLLRFPVWLAAAVFAFIIGAAVVLTRWNLPHLARKQAVKLARRIAKRLTRAAATRRARRRIRRKASGTQSRPGRTLERA